MVNSDTDLRKEFQPPATLTRRIIRSRLADKQSFPSLLAFLAARFTYFDAAAWQKELEAGRLKLNGSTVRQDLPLPAGSLLEYSPPDRDEPSVATGWQVLYEDEELIVVDKPAPLPCHPGGSYFNNTLLRLLEDRFGRLHVITRLDRETAGLVLLAKSASAARRLHECQTSGLINKDYAALVHGKFPPTGVSATGWLQADTSSQVRKKRRFSAVMPAERTVPSAGALPEMPGRRSNPAAESCRSDFALLESRQTEAGWLSLVAARLHTGRNHQIRATLHSLGYPLVGDKLYGLDDGCFIRFSQNRLTEADRRRLILPVQALVCWQLQLPDMNGRLIGIKRPVSFQIGGYTFEIKTCLDGLSDRPYTRPPKNI